jgi:hypothetical protein
MRYLYKIYDFFIAPPIIRIEILFTLLYGMVYPGGDGIVALSTLS